MFGVHYQVLVQHFTVWLSCGFGGLVGVVCGLLVNCIVVDCIFILCDFCLVLQGVRWMPWYQELMKDVAVCDMPRGADEQVLIRGFPNGET